VTNEQLQQWVCEISEQAFGWPFRHQATFNARLRATGGRYFPRTHNIEISWQQWVKNGRDEVEKIIKHELCHYHLHLQKRGHHHRDAAFKQLLKQVGGSRYCTPVVDRAARPAKYVLICTDCGHEYPRKRKVDIRKYACGICRGKLREKAL
jgi:SprT-like protein